MFFKLSGFLVLALPLFLIPSYADGAGSVTINGGAAYTNNTSVALSISYPQTTYRLDVQESGGYATSISPSNSVGFSLSSGDGVKTIQVTAYYTYETSYCCQKDLWGNCISTCFKNISTTDEYKSSITLDTTKPAGTMQINHLAQYTNSTSVTLTLNESDNYLLAGTRFSNCTGSWGPTEPASGLSSQVVTVPWNIPSGDGYKTVYAQIADAAGNWSDVINSTILLDTTPPKSSIIAPAPGYFSAPGKYVTISGTAGDGAGSGVQKIEISYDGGKTWAEPANIMQSGGWATWLCSFMPPAIGTYSIESRATDWANNVESPGPGTYFTVDGTEPVSSINAFSWKKVNPSSAESIAVSPDYVNDRTVFAGTFGGGVLKTVDEGANWTSANSGLGDLKIWSVSVSPAFASYSTVFAGTDPPAAGAGIFKSTDGGTTWSASGSGIPQDSVRNITFSPDYASDGTIFAVTGSGGIYKTTDGGSSWHAAGTLPQAALALAVSPDYAADDAVFAGTASGQSAAGDGVFKSTDGGTTWSQVNSQMSCVSVIGISPDFASDQTVFACGTASDGSGPCLYKSTDGGSTWNDIITGIGSYITGLAISPAFASDNTLYVSTGGGVFKSEDGGATWASSSSGLTGSVASDIAISPGYAQDGALFVGLPEGIFKSCGDTVLVNGADYVINGTSNDVDGSGVKEVEISTDVGNTWEPATDSSGGAWKTWSYSWTVPPDGVYSIKSRATSNVGNVETPGAGVTAIVDNTPPVSAISSPLSGSEIKGTILTISGTATDGAGTGLKEAQVSIDGGNTWINAEDVSGDGSWSAWSCSAAMPADGVYTVQSRGIDYLNNTEIPKAGMTITVDNAIPLSTIDSPKNGAYLNGSELTVTGTTTDNSGLGISKVQVLSPATGSWVDAADVSADGSWSAWICSTAMPADGKYTLQSRAIDSSGNIEIPGAGIGMTVDNTKPTGGINIDGNASFTNNASVTLSISADDLNGITGMEICNDGNFDTVSWKSFTTSENWTLSAGDGEETVYARFMDPAGNISDTCSASILLDTTSPLVNITDIQPSDVLSGPSFNITGTAWDGGSGLNKIEISFGNGVWTEVEAGQPASGTANWNYLWNLPLSGSFTIGARATDNAGNVSAIDSVSVTINNISPAAAEPANSAVRPAAYVLPPDFPYPPVFKWIPNVCENFIIYFSRTPDFKKSLHFASDNHGINPTFNPAPSAWNKITRLGGTIFWKVSGRDAQKDKFYSESRKLILDGGFTDISVNPSTDVFNMPAMNCDPGASSSLSMQFSSEPYFIAPIKFPAHEYGSTASYTPSKYTWPHITRLGPAFYWRFSGKLPTGETTFSGINLTSVAGGPEINNPLLDSVFSSPAVISWDPTGFASCAVQASSAESFPARPVILGVSKTGSLVPGGKAWKKLTALGSPVYIRVVGTTALKYIAYGPPLRLFIK
ncbi:MAG: Ig-like domain repeat protein [Nitrospirota bacterium]